MDTHEELVSREFLNVRFLWRKIFMFELGESAPKNAQIKVIGIGGGGGNAIEHMIAENIDGVEFVCANTDAQALSRSSARTTVQLGEEVTKGLGAGADPEIGRQAAEENRERIK